MKLVELHVDSFGKLKDFTYKFNDDINVVCQNNGFGKTTVAAFVKAMFYGVDSSKRNLSDNARKLYKPWKSDGKFGGTLVFESGGGKKYRVERFFGKTSKDDELKVFDVKTGKDVSNQFLPDVGFSLFALDEDAFERCIFVPQKQIEISSRDSFTAKINNLVEDTDDANNFATATKKLDEFATAIKGKVGGKGLLPAVENDIAQTEKALGQAQAQETAIENKQNQLKELKNTLSVNRQEITQLDELIDKKRREKSFSDKSRYIFKTKKELEDVNRKLDGIKSDFSKGLPSDAFLAEKEKELECYAALESECDVLTRQISEKADEHNENKSIVIRRLEGFQWWIVPAILAIVFAMFAIGGWVKEITGTIGAILTAVFALAAILLAVFFRANRATSEMVQNEKGYAQLYSRLLAKEAEKKKAFEKIAIDFIAYGVTDNYFVALTELKYDKQQHSELTEKHNKLSQEWADIVKEHGEGISENLEEFDENELDGLIAKRKSTQSGIEADGSRLAGEEARLARELETFVPVSEIENKLDGLKSEKTRLQRRYAAAKGAIAALQEAKSNLATSYLPKMRETLQGYFSALTKSNNFKSVDIDETFKISVTEDGASRDMDYFSTGIKEVCVFCLRFALIDTMFKQESPFIMLDDPFVNFDDEKLQEVSVIVQKRAKTNQIVYFTCHKAFEDAVTAENE